LLKPRKSFGLELKQKLGGCGRINMQLDLQLARYSKLTIKVLVVEENV